MLFCLPGACQSYFLNGSATALPNECYRITGPTNYQIGTVWYADELNLFEPFSLEFEMNFGSNDNNGADGLVFVLQTVGTNAIGITGAGMGFQGFNPSFGIEFDTHPNNATVDPSNNLNDPAFDHIAFLLNGNVNHALPGNIAGPVQVSATNANIEDGLNHRVKITWDPALQRVEAWFECQLRLSSTVDLLAIFPGGSAFWGFTGSTGGLNNEQRVCLNDDILGLPESVSICPGESVVLEAAGDAAGTYNWSPADGLSSTSVSNPSASPATTTTYSVSYTDLCNTLVQDEVEVVVASVPVVTTGPDVDLCEGESAMLSVSNNGETILWSTQNGVILFGSNTANPTIGGPGIYTATLTNSDGCEASDQVVVSSIPLPEVELGDNIALCPGATVNIALTSAYDAVNWSTGSSDLSITISEPNVYSVEVTNNGCSATDAVQVVGVQVPEIDLGPDLEACAEPGVTLSAPAGAVWNNGTVGSTFTTNQSGTYWARIDVQGCVNADTVEVYIAALPVFSLGADASLCPADSLVVDSQVNGFWENGSTNQERVFRSSGIYWFNAVNGPCNVRDSLEIIALELPILELGPPRSACLGQEVRLGGDLVYNGSITWSDGSTDPSLNTLQSGWFSAVLENECGSVADSVQVIFEECNAFVYVPNSFTPNNDGVNDVWQISTFNVDVYTIKVFNRWGDMIWSTSDPFESWMGNVQNAEHYIQDGVYAWQLIYKQEFALEVTELRGTVTIIR